MIDQIMLQHKVYGDPNLDWVVLLSNNIVNVQSEFQCHNQIFNTYVTEKYENEETLYSGIHHYESREVKTSDDVNNHTIWNKSWCWTKCFILMKFKSTSNKNRCCITNNKLYA